MKKNKWIVLTVIIVLSLSSCLKDNGDLEEPLETEFLKFKTKSEDDKKGEVLYSEWLDSQFPTSSLNNTEFYSLPLIKNQFLNLDKDLVLVYGKRNNIFNLPVTIPSSQESYIVELLPGTLGTITRMRVSSLDLSPLQDIFFRSTAEAQFRIIIIPGEKLLNLGSKGSVDFKKMTYQELLMHFGIAE